MIKLVYCLIRRSRFSNLLCFSGASILNKFHLCIIMFAYLLFFNSLYLLKGLT